MVYSKCYTNILKTNILLMIDTLNGNLVSETCGLKDGTSVSFSTHGSLMDIKTVYRY